MKDIVKRRRVEQPGKKRVLVVRELECGHEQNEPNGGRAKYATTAHCAECEKKQALQNLRKAVPEGSYIL